MLGDRIREARKAKRLTQKDLADLVNVKNTSISDWEKNLHRPDIDKIPLLSEVLGVKPSWLLEEEPSPYNTHVRSYLVGEIENLPEKAKEELDNFIEFLKMKYSK